MRKLLSLLLALSCLWTATVCVYAQAAPGTGGVGDGTIVFHSIDGVVDYTADPGSGAAPLIDPRFSYFTSLTSRMSETGGKATCTGSVLPYGLYSTSLTLTIERSKDGKDWSKVTSWDATKTTDARFVLERFYYLTRGYSYRLRTGVAIIAGGHVEIAEVLSSTVYY